MWSPQPGPQSEAIVATWCQELLYGGARGGGKSDYLLGDYLQDVSTYGSLWRGIIFRKTYPELEEIIARGQELYLPLRAEYKVQKSTFMFPNGATIKFRQLEREDDANKYQGHQYTWIGWDELGNWATDTAYLKLRACLRSSGFVPVKRIRASANPGGVGHHWVKAMFIDPAPLGFEPLFDELTQSYRMFIPSRVTDNLILLDNDPNYIARLQGTGSPELVKAWLDGDWNVVAGAYYPEFAVHKHVIPPFRVPDYWTKFRAMDWGSARPFSVGWYTVSDGTVPGIPKNALIKYREWYGAKSPNVGLKMTVDAVADGVLLRSGNEKYSHSVADPAIFQEDGGPSIYEQMRKRGLIWNAADNKRIPGWEMLRTRLTGEDDKPMIYFFSTCADTIRTIPILQHDTHRMEDIDTDGEDHAADETRYAVMSRPWAKALEAKKPVNLTAPKTYNQMIKTHFQQVERKNQRI